MDSDPIQPKSSLLVRIMKNLLALFFGCVVAFALLEIFVHIFFPQQPRLYIADPYIRTIHRPNADFLRKEEEFTSQVRTNAQGFVGEDFVVEKPANTTRIAILGDSFTEGFTVDYSEAYPYLLNEKLKQSTSTHNYQVYNFGLGGAGSAHEFLIYDHYVKPYKPDLVVLQFYTRNDYADDLLLKSSPDATSTTRRMAYGKIREFFSNNFEGPRFLIRNIEKVKAIRDVLTGLSITSKDLHNYDDGYPFWFDVFNTREDTAFKTAFTETCDIIGKMKQDIEKNGARMVAFIDPAKEQIFEEDWNWYKDTYPKMKEQTWDMNKATREITTCFTKQGIPFADIEKDLRASLAKGEPRMYYHKDDHFNELGNIIVANRVFELIKPYIP